MYVSPPDLAGRALDAWHQTAAPGGYEGWHVTAFDPASGGGTWVAVSLWTGCPYDPAYLRGYQSYRRRPTDVTPPLPAGWPCAHMVMFREGRMVAESLTRLPSEMFVASATGLDVTVGLNRLVRLPDALRVVFRGRRVEHGPLGARHPKGVLSMEMTLHTISKPAPMREVFEGSAESGEQRWATVAAPCAVKAEVIVRSGRGATATAESIALAGRAVVDHDLGTRPLGEGYTAWVRGVAFLGRTVVPVRVACATARPGDQLAAVYDEDGRFTPLPPEVARVTWTRGKRPYPTLVETGGVVALDSPRVLDERGPVMWVEYRATGGGGQTGQALCQVIHGNDIPRRAGGMFLSPKLAAPAEIQTGTALPTKRGGNGLL